MRVDYSIKYNGAFFMPSLMKSVSILTPEFLKLVRKGWFLMQTHSVDDLPTEKKAKHDLQCGSSHIHWPSVCRLFCALRCSKV